MVDFVNLMEARSLGIEEDQSFEKYWFSNQWIMEPVYFGIRCQCLVDNNGELQFLGKKKSYRNDSIRHLPSLVKELKSYNLPKNSLFDSNLTFNNDRQRASQFLRSAHLEDFKEYEFYFSDVLYLEDKAIINQPLINRQYLLKKLIVTETTHVKLQKGYTVRKKQEYLKLKEQYKMFLFKDLESVYSFKQSSYWRILKVPRSFFMVVMGFVESDQDKFKGMVMALEGGQYKEGKLTKIMNIPVHSSENRSYLYNSKDKVLGKVFEFLALDKTDKGKYEETRYVGIVNDLKPENCIEEE